MKTKTTAALLLVAGSILIGLSFGFVAADEKSVSIDEAVKEGKVKVNITSLGGHSGECISVEVTNAKPTPLKLLVGAGILFTAEDNEEQNILVVKDQVLALKAKEVKKFNIKGYCCESSDMSPDEGSKFVLSKTDNEKLQQLADRLNKTKQIDNSILQEAVWAVSDNLDVSSIYDPDEEKETENETSEVRQFICDLTGRPNAWYNTVQQREVAEDRRITSNPVLVTGELVYTIKAPATVTAELWNDKNEKMHQLGNGMNVPRAGKFSYDFNLKVKGFKSGTYYVVVFAGREQVLKQEFSI